MPAQLCVGLGSGVELLRPPGLEDTLGRHTGASRTWGTLPLLPSLQLRGGCCPTSHPFHLPSCSLPPGAFGSSSRLPVGGAPASPERWARLGEEVGHLPNRTAVTGCLGPWGQEYGDEVGAGGLTHARKEGHPQVPGKNRHRAEQREEIKITTGNACGTSTQIISHMVGLSQPRPGTRSGQSGFTVTRRKVGQIEKKQKVKKLQTSLGNGFF